MRSLECRKLRAVPAQSGITSVIVTSPPSTIQKQLVPFGFRSARLAGGEWVTLISEITSVPPPQERKQTSQPLRYDPDRIHRQNPAGDTMAVRTVTVTSRLGSPHSAAIYLITSTTSSQPETFPTQQGRPGQTDRSKSQRHKQICRRRGRRGRRVPDSADG